MSDDKQHDAARMLGLEPPGSTPEESERERRRRAAADAVGGFLTKEDARRIAQDILDAFSTKRTQDVDGALFRRDPAKVLEAVALPTGNPTRKPIAHPRIFARIIQ